MSGPADRLHDARGPAPLAGADARDRSLPIDTVLVVSTDVQVRGVLVRLLRCHGYAVRAVGRANDALELLESAATNYAAMIIDMNRVPPGNAEVARRARHLNPTLGMVLLSSVATDMPTPCDVAGAGMVWQLAKPTPSAALASAMRLATAARRTGGD